MDFTSAELMLATGGTLSVSAILFLLIQALKEFMPNMGGNRARIVLYLMSAGIGAAVLVQSDAHINFDWGIALLVATLTIAQVGKGIYADVYGRQLDLERMSDAELEALMLRTSQAIESRAIEDTPD